MLVDNELTAAERTELIAALDKSPKLWRRCAIAFMDEQFLTRTFSPEVNSDRESSDEVNETNDQTSIKTKISPANTTNRSPASSSIGWITLGLLVGLGIGVIGNALTDKDSTGIGNRLASYVGWNAPMESESESDSEQELLFASVVSLTNLANEAEALAANYDLPPQRKRNASTKSVRLYEIQNDESKAVYYSPDAIPKFILESMVMAGHEVELTNEKLRTPIGGNQFVELPVFAMRIEKNSYSVNSP